MSILVLQKAEFDELMQLAARKIKVGDRFQKDKNY
jgi:hypothetical protein